MWMWALPFLLPFLGPYFALHAWAWRDLCGGLTALLASALGLVTYLVLATVVGLVFFADQIQTYIP
jgi:hypothetical protein